MDNLRIVKLEIVVGISIIYRYHFRVTRKSKVSDLQLWRLFKRVKLKKTVREVALISFKEALERNGSMLNSG